MTVAESCLLVIQLANPARYSPIKHPNRAKKIQSEVLNQMVDLGYVSRVEAEESLLDYWNNTYDPLRSSSETAYLVKNDKAPYFSEYIRQQLEESLFGSLDYFRDGLIVHTTLDLEFQKEAEKQMNGAYTSMNKKFQKNVSDRMGYINREYYTVIESLSLMFDLNSIRLAGTRQKKESEELFNEIINPALNTAAFLF